jgi:hypothetical protein
LMQILIFAGEIIEGMFRPKQVIGEITSPFVNTGPVGTGTLRQVQFMIRVTFLKPQNALCSPGTIENVKGNSRVTNTQIFPTPSPRRANKEQSFDCSRVLTPTPRMF